MSVPAMATTINTAKNSVGNSGTGTFDLSRKKLKPVVADPSETVSDRLCPANPGSSTVTLNVPTGK